MLCYMASIIVSLPYEEDEPLQLIAQLSRIISTHGAALQGSITNTMKKLVGGAAIGEDDDEEKVPAATVIVNADGTTTTVPAPEAKVLSLEEQLQQLQEECHGAMAMCILLAVKINLQVTKHNIAHVTHLC